MPNFILKLGTTKEDCLWHLLRVESSPDSHSEQSAFFKGRDGHIKFSKQQPPPQQLTRKL